MSLSEMDLRRLETLHLSVPPWADDEFDLAENECSCTRGTTMTLCVHPGISCREWVRTESEALQTEAASVGIPPGDVELPTECECPCGVCSPPRGECDCPEELQEPLGEDVARFILEMRDALPGLIALARRALGAG